MPGRPRAIPEQSARRRTIVLLGLLGLLARSATPQNALPANTPPQSLEWRVKSAFLLNFTKFIEWPASETAASDPPFNICIVGPDPFGPVLDEVIRDETVNGRKLSVHQVAAVTPQSCQMAYFGKQEKRKEPLDVPEPGVLTVGEGESFIRDGGMIAFVLDNRRVRFIVNLSATRAARLTLSSRLLAVAKAVEK